jgi:hypothetical protein
MFHLKEENMKSPTVLLSSLLNDFRRLNSAVGTDRDFITISKRFEHEGFGFLTKALPSLCMALEEGLRCGVFTCPLGFSKTKGGAIPRLFSGMFRDVFDSATGQLREADAANVASVKNLRQILLFMKKLPTDADQVQQLDRNTKEAFVEDDRKVIRFYPDDKTFDLQRVVNFVLQDLNIVQPEELIFRNGPGSVYDGETTNQKWSVVCQAAIQGDLDDPYVGLSDSMNSFVDSLVEANNGRHGIGAPNVGNRRRRATRGVSRLVTVPKTSHSLRTITVEPAVDQFLQQGVNRALRDCIKKCEILSNCLDLTDQSKNQVLAREGSRTGIWATIDLSKASDLLGFGLVELVFRQFPLWELMVACRSSWCEVDGRQFRLRKYAGMGNATTFPVQSVVFALLAICADCNARGVRLSRKEVLASSRRVRVFGDDILVHSDTVRWLVEWLEDFGLKVNVNKSFWSGNFRESCGKDWYHGVDVTPFYLRARPFESSLDAKSVMSLVELSNHMWLNCLYETASQLADVVESFLGKKLPLVRHCSEGLGWLTRQDAYDFRYWNRRLHRTEIDSYVVKTRKRSDVLDGLPALLKCLLTGDDYPDRLAYLSGPTHGSDWLEKTPRRYSSYIVRKRVPA